MGFDLELVQRIFSSFETRGVIAGGRLQNWEKYQPKREDDSTERTRKYRERGVTMRHNASPATCDDIGERGEREEYSRRDADASPDLKSVLFGECLNYLASQNGKDPGKYRPLVGRWLRDFGEQAVYAAFRSAQQSSAVEPVAYIERVLKPNRGPRPPI